MPRAQKMPHGPPAHSQDESEGPGKRSSSCLQAKVKNLATDTSDGRKKASKGKSAPKTKHGMVDDAAAESTSNPVSKKHLQRKRALTSGEAPDVAKKAKRDQRTRHHKHASDDDRSLESGLSALDVSNRDAESTDANLGHRYKEDVAMDAEDNEGKEAGGAEADHAGDNDSDEEDSSDATDKHSSGGETPSGDEGDSKQSERFASEAEGTENVSSGGGTGQKVGKAAVRQLQSAVPHIDLSTDDEASRPSSKARGKARAAPRVVATDTDSGQERIGGLQSTLPRKTKSKATPIDGSKETPP
ncbi:hypothetical protein FA95DRAFT_1578754, partial [Auriscalpium vulgare]